MRLAMICVNYVFNGEYRIISRHHRNLNHVTSRPHPIIQPGLITTSGF